MSETEASALKPEQQAEASNLTSEQQAKLQEQIKAICSNLSLSDSEVQQVQSWARNAIDNKDFIDGTGKRKYLENLIANVKVFCGSNVYKALQDLMDPILQMFVNAEKPGVNIDDYTKKATSKLAFDADYVEHGGEKAFWNHLNKQKQDFDNKKSARFPFFAIVQSSGYGKSRLVKYLQNKSKVENTANIVYFSFAVGRAYPKSNVEMKITSDDEVPRKVVEKAFLKMFQDALNDPEAEKFYLGGNEATKQAGKTQKNQNTGTVFVMDEVSQLLNHFTSDHVTFFRCFRSAAVKFKKEKQQDCFFVLLATQASTTQVVPGIRNDPSYKGMGVDYEAHREPLEPFLMLHAIGLRNDEKDILQRSIDECLQPRNLLAMGRPMWQAYINTLPKGIKDDSLSTFVDFALAKLLLDTQSDQEPANLTQGQCIALLACRACLTISPVSVLASSLVSSHMATAVEMSPDQEEYIVEYPSEPILAIASRSYMHYHEDAFWQRGIQQLKTSFLSSAVPKGHRGEVIVQLLNLMAIDKSMPIKEKFEVHPVDLVVFLSRFDREGALVSTLVSNYGKPQYTEEQTETLEREGLMPQKVAKRQGKEEKKKGDPGAGPNLPKWEGTVCFTHFVYLSRPLDPAPLITPNLLRYTYRRTAGIVVDDERRGIDWIIPVRVGDDMFVGLCGQDKNRKDDDLEILVKRSNEETHYKVTTDFFLSSKEKKLFQDQGWSLDWPAIVFSIGAEDKGAALAEQDNRKLRSNSHATKPRFPCIVLTGLEYHQLVSVETDLLLKQLRDAVTIPSKVYQERVPCIYGCQSDKDKP